MNMMQAGFAFPPGEPCINLALSPNNAVAIRLGPDNDISLIIMEYINGPMEQNGRTTTFLSPHRFFPI